MPGSIDNAFHARSAAVVGASPQPDKVGHIVLANIVNGGYEGRVYPINPKASDILGLRVYPSLSSLPEAAELTVVAVPAGLVSGVLREAASVGSRGAVIITGGFREAGRSDLEAELATIVRDTGIRIVGPNCQGINYRPNKLCASWPLITANGPFAVISRSGTVAATLAGWAAASHTKSLAGDDKVFDAACRQTGVVRAPDLDALYDDAKALGLQPPPRGKRLLIVTSSGGSGILAVDEAERSGLVIPSLPTEVVEELKQARLPAYRFSRRRSERLEPWPPRPGGRRASGLD